jgi:hypothetical protein
MCTYLVILAVCIVAQESGQYNKAPGMRGLYSLFFNKFVDFSSEDV